MLGLPSGRNEALQPVLLSALVLRGHDGASRVAEMHAGIQQDQFAGHRASSVNEPYNRSSDVFRGAGAREWCRLLIPLLDAFIGFLPHAIAEPVPFDAMYGTDEPIPRAPAMEDTLTMPRAPPSGAGGRRGPSGTRQGH